MMGIGGAIKAIVALIIVGAIGFGGYYLINLKADLAVSEMNNQKLQEGLQQQQELLEKQQKDIAQIQETNKELASGAPLNEKEKSAKTPVEANRECPSLVDRNYSAPAN